MGRAPCCSKVGLHRGPWTPKEDSLLADYIRAHGEGQWRSLPKNAGLLRCGKSCRLRWMNYLRPDIKRGNITPDEDDLIIRLHALLGNRWSLIAGRLPGRTDNEIKNYWNTHLSKKLRSQGTDPKTHERISGPKLGPSKPVGKRRSKKERKGVSNSGDVGPTSPSGKKTNALLPKAVRVTPLSLKRDDSVASSDSNLTSALTEGEAAAAFFGGMTVAEERVGFLVGYEEDGAAEEEQGYMVDLRAGDQSMLERLYEEYLELIKAEDDGGIDGDKARELDSFAESLLI